MKNKYGNVLGNYSTYQGTGYFNPLGSAKNRYIISRYNELKAIEDAKVAQKVAEMNKYHYTNLYKHIAETGNRIDGTPASDLEKAVAPYVPWIAPIQDVAAAVAGRQVAKYNSSVPTGNGQQWSSNSETVRVPKADVVTTKPIKDGPYIKNGKPNGRPSLSGKSKLDFERAVYEAQVDSDGILRDPNTKEVIDWSPGEPRKGIADFGHIQGKSYKKIFESYKNGVLTLEELKAFQSNPANFQIEVPKSNRSHKYE